MLFSDPAPSGISPLIHVKDTETSMKYTNPDPVWVCTRPRLQLTQHVGPWCSSISVRVTWDGSPGATSSVLSVGRPAQGNHLEDETSSMAAAEKVLVGAGGACPLVLP